MNTQRLAVVRQTTFRIYHAGFPLRDVSGPSHIDAWIKMLGALATLHRQIGVPLCADLDHPYYRIERITP